MKTDKEIEEKLTNLKIDLMLFKKEYSYLDQISMLSGEGNKLRESISKTQGMIEALEWAFT